VLIRIGENSVTLTPFGSLIRTASPLMVGGTAKSWTEKLRAVFGLLFRRASRDDSKLGSQGDSGTAQS
jgi:hypothetical protein